MKEKVMLVDDDPAIHRVVRLILSEAGYDLSIVDSGRECLEKLRDGFKGLILLDIMMPKLDGWDIIDAMVEEGLVDNVSICLFSVLHDTAARNPDLEQYVVGRLGKPFTCDELIDSVKECLACMK